MASQPATVSAGTEAALERAIRRERTARERAESLLETKSRELFMAGQELQAEHERLQRRNDELEQAQTALKAAQAQLVQSEKLASVGQLAAGVAHEINNPIGFIMSNLGTLKNYTDVMLQLIDGYRSFSVGAMEQSPQPSILEKMKELEEEEDIEFVVEDIGDLLHDSIEGTKRVKDIVQGLKSFSRVDNAEMSEEDLHSGIDSTLRIVENEIKYKCQVIKAYGEVPPVQCNLAQLNQVFMNLIVNAAQAIESDGSITISTSTEDQFAVLRFRDTGEGIPEDKIGSVFDPFFTTKPIGTGTGLGLSISFGIVQEHGGTIEVESEVGVGTEFTIKLPLSGSLR